MGLSHLVLVPARGGSKRLPRKALLTVAGQTLIARTARWLAAEGALSTSILSTDCPDIAAEGLLSGLSVPFVRPADLSTDTADTFDVALHALDFHRQCTGSYPAVLVIAQVTTPFRRRGLLRDALELLERYPKISSVVAMAASKLPLAYHFLPAGSTAGDPEVQSAADCLTPAEADSSVPSGRFLVPTGAIYATRVAALVEQRSIYAKPVSHIEVAASDAVDIDTEYDLLVAQAAAIGRERH